MSAAAKQRLRRELEKAGKGYYALSPAWKDEEELQLHFFLDPVQQDRYEHGWFTVEELLAWCQNQGPVVKQECSTA